MSISSVVLFLGAQRPGRWAGTATGATGLAAEGRTPGERRNRRQEQQQLTNV